MKQNSRLYNARGMTLIEVMIAVGIMSIVSLTLSSLMSYMMRSQGGIKNSSDVQNIVNELQALTSVNSQLCKNALITDSKMEDDESDLQTFELKGVSYPTSVQDPVTKTITYQPNRSNMFIEVSKTLPNNGSIKVKQITLVKEGPAMGLHNIQFKDLPMGKSTVQLKVYRSKLKILFEKNNATKGAAGPKYLYREISMDTTFFAKNASYGTYSGAFHNCTSSSPEQTCKEYFYGDSMILNEDLPPRCRIPMIVSNAMFKLKVIANDIKLNSNIPNYYTGLTLTKDLKIGIGTTDPKALLHIASRTTPLSETSYGGSRNIDNIDEFTEDLSDFTHPGIINETSQSGLLIDSHLEGNILVRGNNTSTQTYSSLCLGNAPNESSSNAKGWCMTYNHEDGVIFQGKNINSVMSKTPALYIADNNRVLLGTSDLNNFSEASLLIDNRQFTTGTHGISNLNTGDSFVNIGSTGGSSCLYLGKDTDFNLNPDWKFCRSYSSNVLDLKNSSGAATFNLFNNDLVVFKSDGSKVDTTFAAGSSLLINGASDNFDFKFENGKITADNQVLNSGLTLNNGNSSKVTIDTATIDAPKLDLNIKTINATGPTTFKNGLDLTGSLTINGSISKVTGDIYVDGTVTAKSDINLKKNIEIIPNSLERILKVKGVLFDWIDPQKDSRRQMGLIAQNVEKVFPELVYTNDHGIKSIAYQNLVAPLIEAVKSLWQMVQDLKQEVLQLKQELLALKTQQQNWNQKMNQQESELKQIKMALCQSQPKLQMCYGFR